MARYTRAEVDGYIKIRGRIIGSRIFIAQFVGAVFIVLKLFGALSWSWWWVTSPIWGGVAYFLLALIGIAVFGGLFLASQPKPAPTPTLKTDPLHVVRADDA